MSCCWYILILFNCETSNKLASFVNGWCEQKMLKEKIVEIKKSWKTFFFYHSRPLGQETVRTNIQLDNPSLHLSQSLLFNFSLSRSQLSYISEKIRYFIKKLSKKTSKENLFKCRQIRWRNTQILLFELYIWNYFNNCNLYNLAYKFSVPPISHSLGMFFIFYYINCWQLKQILQEYFKKYL